MQLDLQPANVRVKELETVIDELQSELAVKSKDMEALKSEKKSVMDKLFQLKRKHNFKEDDSVMPSQPTVLDSLQHDPEVSTKPKANVVKFVRTYICHYVYVKV